MAFFHRVRGSFVAMFFGILIVPVSVALHAWNEYRTIHRSRGLAEAAELVVSIPEANAVAVEYHQRLVHLFGLASTDEVLVDKMFGIRENAIHLARRVEMYQWIEDEETDDEGDKSYSYSRGWEEGRIDSDSFHHSGYDNPPLAFPSLRVSADHVFIGAYELNETLKNAVDSWEIIDPNHDSILESLGTGQSGELLFQDQELFWGREKTPDPDHPELGDIRIRFEKVAPTTVSLVSMLVGNTFDPYTTTNGEKIERLYVGQFTAAEVVEKLKLENVVQAWILRFAGLVLCVVGFNLILGPIKALVSWLPIVRELTGIALFAAGSLLALAVSLTTIAIAWIAVRPLLAIVLLAVSLVACVVIFKLRRSIQEESSVIATQNRVS